MKTKQQILDELKRIEDEIDPYSPYSSDKTFRELKNLILDILEDKYD